MASEIISVIVSRFQGGRRRHFWFRGEDRAQAVSVVRVMRRYGKYIFQILLSSYVLYGNRT